MMINISNHRAEFDRAWHRAEKLQAKADLLVSDGHLFRVPSASEKGKWHLVEIFQNAEGDIVAACDCLGATAGRVCYHIAAAARTFIQATDELNLLAACDNDVVM